LVTGMGVVSPLGCSLEELSRRVFDGISGIDFIEDYGWGKIPGGKIREEELDPVYEKDSRPVRFSMMALKQALTDGGISEGYLKDKRAAVIMGGSPSLAENHKVYELLYKRYAGNPPDEEELIGCIPYTCGYHSANKIAERLGITGHVETISNACASGAAAIGKAATMVMRGDVDIAIAGGSDASLWINEIGLFSILNLISKHHDGRRSCRPFSADRTGCVIGEGAGVVTIESEKSAADRNARAHGRILGYGAVTDNHHVTSPDMEGSAYKRAMSRGLKCVGVKPGEIDYINAHGTGTYYNDLLETKAIKSVFDEKNGVPPTSSTKAISGHLLAAAGALECIITLLAIQKGSIPPTMHLEEEDGECDLDYVKDRCRKADLEKCISNSFGFGGQNVTLVLGR
jgi:3-oxoacyl-[acyl-carrier-protein] synthase II